ncbi:hypothetical protein [Pseudomonas sp. MAG733B]|uniref:hypothetical protein n=1 Tax=Pseudomonas sp. MAG733B TaxID=3122079 RepID=UPI0030CF164B
MLPTYSGYASYWSKSDPHRITLDLFGLSFLKPRRFKSTPHVETNEHADAAVLYRLKATERSIMYSEAKMLAYAKWHDLLTDSEIPLDADERYDELLKLADDFRSRGIIDTSARNTLIKIATVAYTRSVEHLLS